MPIHIYDPAPQVGDGLHPAPDLNRQAYVFIPADADPQALEFYELVNQMLQTHDRKRQDYAPGEDRFKNLRQSEALGVPAWVGTLIRKGDKVSRITELAHREWTSGDGPVVKEESIVDTLMDDAVYALLGIILYRQWKAAKR